MSYNWRCFTAPAEQLAVLIELPLPVPTQIPSQLFVLFSLQLSDRHCWFYIQILNLPLKMFLLRLYYALALKQEVIF